MNKKTVKVYDTFTGKIVDVEVTQKVYEAYMRTEWNIHDNNESFYEHEIQFSQLIGGENNAFENFHEFILEGDPTSDKAILLDNMSWLNSCLKMLEPCELDIIVMIYFKDMTEQKCATALSTTRQNIHNKHRRILAKIYKLIKNR